MTSTATKPAFTKGGEAAEEAAKAASGGGFRKTHYLNIDDGEQVFLRYITDSPDWISVKQHNGALTKNKPAGIEGNWPKQMNAVCRYDPAFAGMYSDCYICDAKVENGWGKVSKPQVRVWALAVLREEVIGTQEMADAGEIEPDKVGRRIGLRDATREVEIKDGDDNVKTVIEPALIVVNQPVGNYFGALQSAYNVYGSISDRDFSVQRKGEGKDSEYYHHPLDVTPNLKPGTERWARYPAAVEEQGLALEELVAYRASDEYYGDLFDPSKETSRVKEASATGDKGAPATQQEAKPSNDSAVDEEKRRAIRDRVRVGSPSLAEVD